MIIKFFVGKMSNMLPSWPVPPFQVVVKDCLLKEGSILGELKGFSNGVDAGFVEDVGAIAVTCPTSYINIPFHFRLVYVAPNG